MAITAIDVSPDMLSSPPVRLVVGPLPQGITVSLQPQSGAPPFTSVLQAHVGVNVPPGKYLIEITAVSTGGNYSLSYSLSVVQQQGTPPHDVTVVVHDVYGIPVSGASVTFKMGGWSDTLDTTGSGAVVFSQIPPGPYNVTVSYMGASSVLYGNANTSQLGVTIVLSPPVALTVGGFVVVSALVVLVRRLRRTPVI